jgi:ABC-type histidine transport system ATPase subunit
MRKNTKLSDEAIRSALVEHRMDQPIRLSRYAGTPRALLGMLAGYALQPDVLLFSTSGLDPKGVGEIHRIVSTHLSECSAIYLAAPCHSQEREHWMDYPGSVVISVVDLAKHGAPDKMTAKL